MRSRATATESTSKPGWASPSIALGAAVATAAYLAATMIGLELSRRGGAAVVLWPAGGVLLAILVRTRLAAWPLYVAGCAAAGFAATMLFGASAGLALGLAAVNVIEAAIGAALLRRMFATPVSLSTLGEGAAFLAAAVLAAPAAGALLGGGLLAAVEGASIWHEWQAWFAAHAVGVIVVAPALITWSPRYLAEFRSPRRALEGVAFVAVLAAVSFLVLTARGARHLPSRHPVGCNPVRYIRLRRGGACGRRHRHRLRCSREAGPLLGALIDDLAVENRLLFLRLAMGNLVLTPMAVAILVAERRVAADEIKRLNEDLEERVRHRVAAYERSQEALRESEERARRLVETMNEGFGILDVEGALTYVNDRMCDMLDYRPADLLGRRFVDLMDPDGPRPAKGDLAPRERRTPLRTTLLRADGGRLPALVSPRALTDARGRVTGSFAVITDISELIDAENIARQRQSELAHMARVASMGEMASTLAHELNQPLTSIVNYAGGSMLRLRRDPPMDAAEVSEALQRISDQAVRASEMITHIFKFVRKTDDTVGPIDINPVIRRITALVEPEMSKNRVEVRLQLGEKLFPVAASPIQVEQVVLNLLRNGIESYGESEDEDREIIVHSSRHAADDTVEIAVTDRGRGLSEVDAERAFEPFFTTKRDGMGMGLAISRSIVEGYGGRMWAAANPDRGMTFRFTLPSAADGAPS